MTIPTHRIAVIPGDGIGTEVMPPAQRLLELAGHRFGFAFEWRNFDWSCEYYARTGARMPADGIESPLRKVPAGGIDFQVAVLR